LPIPIASSIFPALSCTNFKVLGLILRSLTHFELILIQGDQHGSSFSFLQADNHYSQQYLLKWLSFLHHMFWHLCQKLGGKKIRCVDSYLCLLFCFTGIHICFCASTMLFLLLWLCSTV
jgi:hypothetical protein